MAQLGVSEAQWEQIALETLAEWEWRPLPGTAIAPGTEDGRPSWGDVILPGRMLAAMRRLNPQVPAEYLDQAVAAIVQPTSQDPVAENYRLHQICVQGYRGVSYVDSDSVEQNPTIRLVSHRVIDNERLAVNQVTVRSTDVERRFDLVLYLNGMPIAIFELKKPSDSTKGLAGAHAQLATYLREFPMAFRFAVLTVISDGYHALYGTPFTPFNHYSPWNVGDDGKPVKLGEAVDDTHLGTELEFLIEGVFNPEQFLQPQRGFTAYDAGADGYEKRIAKPHQYFAVTKAVGSTVAAVESNGKAGVVWHTQGSGKSMEMELYVHLVSKQPKLKNPTIVLVTDRKELDGQLYETFNRSTLLSETPVKVTDRSQLREGLANRVTGDGATVPVFFEPRLIKVGLTEGVSEDDLDKAADEATTGLDEVERAQIEKSVAVAVPRFARCGGRALLTRRGPRLARRRCAVGRLAHVHERRPATGESSLQAAGPWAEQHQVARAGAELDVGEQRAAVGELLGPGPWDAVH